ncbi:ribonuclease J [candidate division WWE3 bacterium]|nr:ribonuclease J [candidate division WWE3 bacterium]
MNKLRYIPLGGVGEVTKNMHVWESDKDIIVIDAGIGFPETEQLGVDVVIPDVGYLRDRKDRIRAILISHAHEDHIGGLPYVLEDLGRPPVYAAKLPRGFIQNKLSEFNLLKGQTLNLIDPDGPPIRLGEFEITPYRVNHSVPDTLGFFIRTPFGNLVHSPDFKFDWTPVDGKFFQIGKLARLVEEGVLALFSDCLGSNAEGYTESERKIQHSFEREMENAPGQVFITTMSSNISRMQQAINASVKYGRQIVPVGRSIDQNIEIAVNLGYLNVPEGILVPLEKAHKIHPSKITYIIAGSFGQKGSALDRLSRGENRNVQLLEDDVVIFSADPIPGIFDQVGAVIDNLTTAGARVVYSEIQDDLHVSGHGTQGDLSIMAAITRPKYFVPIGGTPRHQKGYAALVERMGFDPQTVFELRENQTIEFIKGKARVGDDVITKDVFVDGSVVGDVGRVVLEDRQKMAEEGIFVVIVKKQNNGNLVSSVDVVSRGFIYMAGSDALIKQAQKIASNHIEGKTANDWSKVRDVIEADLQRFFYKKTKREPMILPVMINL